MTVLTIPLAVINATKILKHEEVLKATAALQIQVHRDFSPSWNVSADLAVVAPGDLPPTEAWWIVILDNSDLGSALGYHDLTSQGLPLAKVFVQAAIGAGQEWTVLFSHEILEMLANPYICLTAFVPSASGIFEFAYENCDACQSDQTGYRIDDQLVSDFCLPSWFDARQFGQSGPFDFLRLMRQPFELLPGGYAMCRNLSSGSGWQLVTATGTPLPYSERPRVGSRRERRNAGSRNWVSSDIRTGRTFTAASLLRPQTKETA